MSRATVSDLGRDWRGEWGFVSQPCPGSLEEPAAHRPLRVESLGGTGTAAGARQLSGGLYY